MKKVLLILLFVFAFFTLDLSAASAQVNLEGMTFKADKKYLATKKFEDIPNTIKFEICVPLDFNTRVGTVFGNYTGEKNNFNVEIDDRGKPRFYYTNANGKNIDIKFDTDVRTGEWVELAIVYDEENSKVLCYRDGVLCGETVDKFYDLEPTILNEYFVIGGDNRLGNELYFKGKIRSLTLYSDAKNAEEITETVNLSDADLIGYYEMNSSTGDIIADCSNNQYNFKYTPDWYTDKEEATGYAYSFAVVGDTQNITKNYPDKLDTLYQWIVDNKDAKKINQVIGVGDIVQDGDDEKQWSTAYSSVSKLFDVLPYTLIRGNHDSSYWLYNTFGSDSYKSQFDGFYKEDNINSSYKTFTAGSTDYLLVTIDYGADDAELAWASTVVNAHPNHRVIVVTHAYLFTDGTTLSTGEGVMPADGNDSDSSPTKVYNDGEDIWNKFVSQHSNISLVLCGHQSCDDVVTTQLKGVNGNIVTQMLIDPQDMDLNYDGGTGMVCMLYFNEDGSKMEVEFYSTIRNEYFKVSNQYTVDLLNEGTAGHVHNYVDTYNDNEHWTGCTTCDDVKNKAAHTFDSNCDTTCNGCTYAREAIEHSYTLDRFDETNHYKACDACQAIDSTSIISHSYDNGCDTTCNECEYVRATSHAYETEKHDGEHHWLECEVCGETDSNSKQTHTFDNACDTTCNGCSYTRTTTHDYSISKNDGENYWDECSICGDKKATTGPQVEPTPSKGCGGAVVGTVSSIVVLLCFVLFLKLKKNNKKSY